jgi:hypothetical protein
MTMTYVRKFLTLAIGILALTIGSTVAEAFKCTGNACNDVLFSFTNGCYTAHNHGARNIHVTMGQFGFDLQPTETHTLKIGTTCIGSYLGGETANYNN